MDEEKLKEAAADGDSSEAKAKSPLIPMLVAALVATGAAYGVVHYVLKPMLHPDSAQAHTEKAEPEEPVKGEIVRFENIIVNPSGTMGSRYLSTTVGLEVTDEASREAVIQSEPMIKDALITHLSSRTIDELTDASAREQMREAIRAQVNSRIAPSQVRAVYFLDFVLQ